MTDDVKPQKGNAFLPHITIEALCRIKQTDYQSLSEIPAALVARTASTWKENMSPPIKQESTSPTTNDNEQLFKKLEQTLQEKGIDSSLLNKTLQEILQLEKADEKAINDKQDDFLDFSPKPNPAQENLNQLFKFPQLLPNYRTHFTADATEQDAARDEIFFDYSQQTYPDIRTLILQERERRALAEQENHQEQDNEEVNSRHDTSKSPVLQEDLALNNSNQEEEENITTIQNIAPEEITNPPQPEEIIHHEQELPVLESQLEAEHLETDTKSFSASEYVQTENFTGSYKINTPISWQEFKSQYNDVPQLSKVEEDQVDATYQSPLPTVPEERLGMESYSEGEKIPFNNHDVSSNQNILNKVQKPKLEVDKTVREEPKITLPISVGSNDGFVSTDSIHTREETISQKHEKETALFSFTKYLHPEQPTTGKIPAQKISIIFPQPLKGEK